MATDTAITHPTPESKVTLGLTAWTAIGAGIIAVALLIWHSLAHGHHGHAADHGVSELPAMWGVGILPFVAILGAIAVLPVVGKTHMWWESNLNRLGVALCCAACTLLYIIGTRGLAAATPILEHAIVLEYIPFIMLLFALYVISGGISLTGDLVAKPLTNTAILAFGAGIASFIGTTGASMLLIRPLLQTNSERKHVVHTVVFFIFLVSNIGGTLLPIGDPPLFLGYLKGVPFFWTFSLWGEWAVCCVILLAIYFVWDSLAYKKESASDIQRDNTETTPLRLRGWSNLLLLGGVVACVALISDEKPLLGTDWVPFKFFRELCMLGLVGASLMLTPKGVRKDNNFNYTAILEVAALFIGIFIAMQVPIEVLKACGPMLTENYITEPWHYYWATGGLSGFLDNAPTYVVFFTLGEQMPIEAGAEVVTLTTGTVLNAAMLTAVSLGAVFMGALTYIGNGPNFMVKSIAEQSGVKMPSFFGYMFKYSLPVLVPVFVLIMVLFLL